MSIREHEYGNESEARGCELRFLPAYSPDCSPSEETFSKIKAFLRRVGARTHEALQEALAQALEIVTAADALGWFTHCGYQSLQVSEGSMGSIFSQAAVGQIDYFAVYCRETNGVYLMPIDHVGASQMSLRLVPTKNSQEKNVRWAKNYQIL